MCCWRLAAPWSVLCSASRATSLSSLSQPAIPSTAAWSQACHGQAETRPASCCLNTVSAENGWNSSKATTPHITRAAVIRDASEFSGVAEFAAIQAIAPSLGVDLSPIDPRDAGAMERAIKDIAHQADGGLIVTQSGASIKDRDRIIALAAQERLPAAYANRLFVTAAV